MGRPSLQGGNMSSLAKRQGQRKWHDKNDIAIITIRVKKNDAKVLREFKGYDSWENTIRRIVEVIEKTEKK